MSSTVVGEGEKVIHPVARRWTRHKLDVPIRVIVHLEDKSRVISGRGKEISEGGMAVFAGVELRVGDKIEVEFTPPYGGPIRVLGIVRNRNGYSYGVEFFAVTEETGSRKGAPARRAQQRHSRWLIRQPPDTLRKSTLG